VGIVLKVVWGVLYFVATTGVGILALTPRDSRFTDQQRDRALFFFVVLIVAPVVYFFFLKHLSYLTRPWYYLALMALMGLAIDEGVALLAHRMNQNRPYLGLAALLFAFSLPPAVHVSKTRFTNIDAVAAALRQRASAQDFILVNPWYYGVTFARYHESSVCPWETLPPMTFHLFHRYDLIKDNMVLADQEAPVRAAVVRMAATLQAGHRVFLVGGLHFLQPGQSAFKLPPAPYSQFGWVDGPYYESWSTQAASFIQKHAARAETIPLISPSPVSELENVPLIEVSGWRE